MPDFLSHSLFADALLERGGWPLLGACKEYGNLFRLGSQGPDVFYYCGVLRPRAGYAALADRLHETNASAVIKLIEKNRADGAKDAPARSAYLLGFLAHLCLDAAAHPFVCEKARALSREAGVSESCAHVMFESTIEARELFEKRGIEPRAFRFRCDLPRGAAQRRLVAALCGDIIGAAGIRPPLDTRRFAAVLAALPLLFSVIFDRTGAAKAVLDAKYARTGRDFETRWHIKRPYRPDAARRVLTDGEYETHLSLVSRAQADFFKLDSTRVN